MKFVGVDGCPDGWIAVTYEDKTYSHAKRYTTIAEFWNDLETSAEVLIDIPIGLRENTNTKRPCDVAAREKLRPKRNRSVFPTPIREVARKAHLDNLDYEKAKRIQETETDGSISPWAWGIIPKIGEVDHFLLEVQPEAQKFFKEAHPELCFWAFNGGHETAAMTYSKTGQPAAAFWERIEVLQSRNVEPRILHHMKDVAKDLDWNVSNDDLLDAFALALTASPKTNPTKTLPETWPDDDDGDPLGLPMEMTYPTPG